MTMVRGKAKAKGEGATTRAPGAARRRGSAETPELEVLDAPGPSAPDGDGPALAPEVGDDEPDFGEPRDEDIIDVEPDDALPVVGSEADDALDFDADEGWGESAALVPRDQGVVRRDPLDAYMQEIRRYPLLSREEEHELAVKYFETGDVEIAKRLVTANLRLVVKIAHEYRRAYRNLLDLIQEGNIGLMQAVKKFDPYRGVKLSSYAAWWIRAYMLRFILNNWRLVKIGTTQAQRKLFFNLRKEKEKLERLGFQPEHKLLAERLEVSEEDVAEMERRLEQNEMSLDAPVSRDDEGSRTRMELLPGSSETRPDVRAESEEFRALLREKLEAFGRTLKGRDRTLFEKRWLTDNPLTLQELGDKFGISRERARQIEKRLLGKLRKYLEEELGSAVVDLGGPEE